MIEVPTAAESSSQVLADIEGAIGQKVPILQKAFIRVLSKAIGGLATLMYRVARWSYQQIFAATCGDEALTLKGQQYDMAKTPAVAAILNITIVGTPGTIVPVNTVWVGTNSISYLQVEEVLIPEAGIVPVNVTCSESGTDGSLGEGNVLDLASPVSGVTSAYVNSIETEGEDSEATEDFRLRVMQREAAQPQGGSASDYVCWACRISGIVKAFAFRTATGTVTVYPLKARTGTARIPSADKILEVQDYLQNPAVRPLCATVYAAAMNELTVDITISGLTPSNSSTKAAIISAMREYLYAAYPKQYPDEINPTCTIGVGPVWAAITAAGAVATGVTMTVEDNGTVTSFTLGSNEIVTLGTITWA